MSASPVQWLVYFDGLGEQETGGFRLFANKAAADAYCNELQSAWQGRPWWEGSAHMVGFDAAGNAVEDHCYMRREPKVSAS